MSFESELREIIVSCITIDEMIVFIKSLISKYAPKEFIIHNNSKQPDYYRGLDYGYNTYRTELFKELGI